MEEFELDKSDAPMVEKGDSSDLEQPSQKRFDETPYLKTRRFQASAKGQEGDAANQSSDWMVGADGILAVGEDAGELADPVISDWAGALSSEGEDLGAVVYVGVALDVAQHIWAQYCTGERGQFPLHQYLRAQDADAQAVLHTGHWKYLVCGTFEEAEDFRWYVVQALRPLLVSEQKDWKAQYSSEYQDYLTDLEASAAVVCDDLISQPSGPGVFVFYHPDRSFWDNTRSGIELEPEPVTEPEPVAEPEPEPEPEEELDEQTLLRQAVKLSQTGQSQEALELLAEVIRKNPLNDIAWLWYAYSLPATEDRMRALKECLFHNPDSREARNRLEALEEQEELRIETERRMLEVKSEIAQIQGEIESLEGTLYTRESELVSAEGLYATAVEQMEQAERTYKAANEQVIDTKRKLSQFKTNLSQLQEELAEGESSQ